MTRMLLRLSLYLIVWGVVFVVGALLLGRVLPSSGQIAYMALGGRSVELWTLDPMHGIALSLADHAFTGPSMFPSPDGQQIAFFREERGSAELHVINVDGSHLRRLEDVTPDLAIAWLPNNREIVIGSIYGTYHVYDVWTLEHNALPQREIIGCGLPVLSPNGQRIVTSLSESGGAFFCTGTGIAVINADDGSDFIQFLPDELDLSAVWSPDSQYLALFGPGGLFVAADEQGIDNRAASIQQLLRFGLNSSLATPVWSPDGTRIAIVMGNVFDVHVVPVMPEVGEPLNLTPLLSMELYPAWSPDGTHIAFASTMRGTTEIYTVDVETRAIQRVTTNTTSELNLVWLP